MSGITESYIEIMNLVYAYPERIDAGDFAGVGELFADAVFETEGGQPLVGSRAVQENFERWTRRYPDDGTPKTRHCIHNPIVEIDEANGSAVVRYYVTVFQRTPDFPLQPVWANRYEDRFVARTAAGVMPTGADSGTCPGTSAPISCRPRLRGREESPSEILCGCPGDWKDAAR
ncbi:MAG: nuclear transport factor 2 family protein [Myxococcota bacterium]